MKNVLIINPPTGNYIRDDRCQVPVDKLVSSARTPIDLLYLAAVARNEGKKVFVRDYPVEGKTKKDFVCDLNELKPDVLLINTTTPTFLLDMEIAQLAKEIIVDLIVIIKGAHVVVNDNEILEKFKFVDICLKRDYEFSFREIMKGIHLSKIRGITYRDKLKIVQNVDREIESNLDSLPVPARDLIDNNFYLRPDTNEPMTAIMVNRGCPNNCSFCLVKITSGKKVCQRSAQSVVDEIKLCQKEFGINNFYFRADTFNWNRQWVIELCQEINKHNLKIEWVSNSRVDNIDEELIRIMKQSGCWMLSFGVETGNKKILDEIHKGISYEQVEKAVDLCRKYKIKTYLFYMYGFPDDTKKSLHETLLLAKQLNSDFIELHMAFPFPGTELYQEGLALGLFKKDDLFGHNVFDTPLKTKYLSNVELKTFRKKALRSYYSRPRYIINQLKSIDSITKLLNYIKKAIKVLLLS